MESYMERLLKESKELQEKISKLCAFIGTKTYLSLSQANRILLENQCEVMKQYRDILDVRIELNNGSK